MRWSYHAIKTQPAQNKWWVMEEINIYGMWMSNNSKCLKILLFVPILFHLLFLEWDKYFMAIAGWKSAASD